MNQWHRSGGSKKMTCTKICTNLVICAPYVWKQSTTANIYYTGGGSPNAWGDELLLCCVRFADLIVVNRQTVKANHSSITCNVNEHKVKRISLAPSNISLKRRYEEWTVIWLCWVEQMSLMWQEVNYTKHNSLFKTLLEKKELEQWLDKLQENDLATGGLQVLMCLLLVR